MIGDFLQSADWTEKIREIPASLGYTEGEVEAEASALFEAGTRPVASPREKK